MNDFDINKELDSIRGELRTINLRLAAIEAWQKGKEHWMNDEVVKALTDAVEELSLLVKGDPELGLLPLRQVAMDNKAFRDRVMWIVSFLGVTTLAGIIALFILLQRIAELMRVLHP